MFLKFFLLVCVLFLRGNIFKKPLSSCLHCLEKHKLSFICGSTKHFTITVRILARSLANFYCQ